MASTGADESRWAPRTSNPFAGYLNGLQGGFDTHPLPPGRLSSLQVAFTGNPLRGTGPSGSMKRTVSNTGYSVDHDLPGKPRRYSGRA